jgi:hypothetical protein
MPFQRQETIDKPGIIGARWWQQSVATQSRRQAMTGLLALGGVMAAIAGAGTCVAVRAATSDDFKFEPRSALDMQKQYGWNFGATGDSLVFDGTSTKPFDRGTLLTMADQFAPADVHYAPFFVPTLFQSLTATPKAVPSGEDATTPVQPLMNALVPISTPATTTAFKQGQALASLLDTDPRAKDVAVIVDLPGPEAVAFAAGASSVLDPIFLFDNWPHPRGVVPAHMTLASAAYYQPLFAAARTSRASRPGGARPMFVLDRNRLASYSDDASQFDNRHTARVPNAASLAKLGLKNILYVSPNAVQRQELDDLADDFVGYTAARVPIHVAPASAFEPSTSDVGDAGVPKDAYFYGGSPTAHRTFWTHWTDPPSNLSTNDLELYVPKPRVTPFSTGSASASRPRPTNFGMIPVAIAVGTGVILGAKLSRSGSWNRTSSWSSGS